MKIPHNLSRSHCLSSLFYTLSWESSIEDAKMDIQSFFDSDVARVMQSIRTRKDYLNIMAEEDHSSYLDAPQFFDEAEWLIVAYRIRPSRDELFWVLDMSCIDDEVNGSKIMGWMNLYLEIDDISREVLPFRKPFL